MTQLEYIFHLLLNSEIYKKTARKQFGIFKKKFAGMLLEVMVYVIFDVYSTADENVFVIEGNGILVVELFIESVDIAEVKGLTILVSISMMPLVFALMLRSKLFSVIEVVALVIKCFCYHRNLWCYSLRMIVLFLRLMI